MMVYLSSFKLSEEQVSNPNIYPYNVFQKKSCLPFIFSPITVFYGNNGSGKSTILNIMANKLELKGKSMQVSWSLCLLRMKINKIYCVGKREGCDFMLVTKPQIKNEKEDISKLELYRLIGEAYKAMQEGRESTLESVKEKNSKRRLGRV